MFIGGVRLCLSVLRSRSIPTLPQVCTDPDVTWGNGSGCSLVVHYWADLQSVHRTGFVAMTTRM